MSDVTVHDVQAWLKSYGELQTAIENQRERLETMRSRLESPRSATLTGLPGGGGDRSDRIGAKLAHIAELEAHLEEDRQTARELYRAIEESIRQIHGPGWPDKRAVLRMRYLDGETWPEACRMIFGRKPDFEYRQDSYLRRTFSVHKTALAELLDIYSDYLKGSDTHETRRS